MKRRHRTYYKRKSYKRYRRRKSAPLKILIPVCCLFALFTAEFFLRKGIIMKGILLLILLYALYLLFKSFLKAYKKGKYLNSDISRIDTMTGEEFEEYLKALFERKGYCVIITPGSGDYGVDLICQKKEDSMPGKVERIAIQAKRYRGKVGIEAVQQVIAGARYYDCNKAMVITNSFYTPNARNLAQKSDCLLWDRKTLKQEINRLNKANKE